jgi:type I restriction enzyme, S subunit
MKLETFFNNFDLLADAPNSVQKLRELILQLAVMGKLVPQDENDEPASALLEKIKLEKELLVKEGKIKNLKELSAIKEDEIAYILPSGWEWARFVDITSVITCGIASTPKYTTSGKIFLSAKNIKPYRFMPEEHKFVSEEDYLKITQGGKPEINDILLTRVGAGIGEAAIIDKNLEFAYYVSLTLIKPFKNYIYSKYILHWLNSPEGVMKALQNTYGKGVSQGNLNVNQVRIFNIPLPPLAEQHRIVAKVDELMAMCDRISSRQQQKRETRILINNAAIGQLLTAREPEVFNKSWQHICNNFDLLYSTPDNIGKLRQAILQLAVQGKLVPQDENDEPASVLLEKIKFEKEQLVKEGKIGKPKSLSPIEISELPFKQPSGWEWERFGEIAELVSGVTKGRNLVGRKTAFYPYMRVANVQRGFLDIEVMKQIEIPVEELEKYRLQIGDVLLTEGGDWDKLGRSAIWEGKVKDCIHQNHVFRARLLHTSFASQWVVLYTNSPVGRRYFETASKKTTNLASINMTQLRHCPLPIPPLAEQKRIIAKVNQLMSLCDELETKLTQSVTDSEKLMEVAVRQILAANSTKTDKHESTLLETIPAETTKLETKTAKRHNKKTQGQDEGAVQLNLPLF